ncbi:MAG: tetratricopeptide repeat protein [Zoogloeaceae bacterium]|jgi:Tfp pilus assembly protein PilF|nr:tetratricopeptide repeat protein [Zoogloeaceae bacterium]
MKLVTMLAVAGSLALALAAPIHADSTATSPQQDERMKSAGELLSGGKYSDAIHAYQDIIGSDSSNALAWVGLGLAYLHAGDHDLARAALDEAIRVDPSREAQLSELKASLQARHDARRDQTTGTH